MNYIYYLVIVLFLVSCESKVKLEESTDFGYFYKKDYAHLFYRTDTLLMVNDSIMLYKYTLNGENFKIEERIQLPVNEGSKIDYKKNELEHIYVTHLENKNLYAGNENFEISLFSIMSSSSDSSFFLYFNRKFGMIRIIGFSRRYDFFQLIKKEGKHEQVLFNLNELIMKYMKPPSFKAD